MTISTTLTDGKQASCKKRPTTVIVNEYSDVSFNQFFFPPPEYLFPWFLGPINSPHAASSGKNQGQQCRITKYIGDEQSKVFSLSNHILVFYILLILSSNAGNNPVQPEGKTAIAYNDNNVQPFITPGPMSRYASAYTVILEFHLPPRVRSSESLGKPTLYLLYLQLLAH